MIFVTVGTHEQGFNRLIESIDNLKKDGKIHDEIIIQTGFSSYEPKYCTWSKLFSYDQMKKNIAEAKIVITHGGPASFIMPIQIGKIPIVVPRQYKFNEHVNDHQVEFVEAVSKKIEGIITVINIKDLENTIKKYDSIVLSMSNKMISNNEKFNQHFEKIVGELF